jgi:hypothetical protein
MRKIAALHAQITSVDGSGRQIAQTAAEREKLKRKIAALTEQLMRNS